MDQTLHALGVLFLKALPTFILVLLLHFYLKRMFFAPLQRALKRREEHSLQVEVQQQYQNESGQRFQEQHAEGMKSLVHLMSAWSESGVLTQTLKADAVRGPESPILT